MLPSGSTAIQGSQFGFSSEQVRGVVHNFYLALYLSQRVIVIQIYVRCTVSEVVMAIIDHSRKDLYVRLRMLTVRDRAIIFTNRCLDTGTKK